MSKQELAPEILSRGHNYGVKHFIAPSSGHLLGVVSSSLNLNAEKIQNLLYLGAVYKNEHRVLTAEDPIVAGDHLRVHTTPRRYPTENINLDIILYENDDYVVVNKPSGVPVHATVDNLRDNLISVFSERFEKSLKITHRLDIATQGLLVLAKTENFQKKFNADLASKTVIKRYRAHVTGENHPALKTHVHYMEPSPRAPKKVSPQSQPGWAKCVLTITNARELRLNLFEVEILLQTGRTHQIRAQMAAIGNPLAGDTLYGGDKELPFFLQCYELQLADGISFSLDH